MTTTPTDSELVALVADGDDTAYDELYRRHAAVARWRAYQLADVGSEAEDLVSYAFMAVLQAIRNGARPEPFRPYLWAALRTGANRLCASRRPYLVVSLDGDHHRASIDIAALGSDPAAISDAEPIREAFRSLPPRWKIALWHSAVEGRQPAELAVMLDLSQNAAAALTCRARRRLRRAYEERQCLPDTR